MVVRGIYTQESIRDARAAFPRGLEQPGGSLRFGLDALLLAAFAARHCEERRARLSRATPQALSLSVAELGCGCGAALLGLALRCPEARGLGLEREENLLEAARRNARELGLEQSLLFRAADLAVPLPELDGTRDMVLANPPYGLPGQGRASPSLLRERALRDADALGVFCRAAARLLRHHGHFFCIFEARSLPRLCAAFEEARLGLRRIIPVRPHSHSPATRLLAQTRKGAAPEPRLEAPLTLHRQQPGRAARTTPLWTARALAFCPWLAAATT
ncbi:tRNA1(Val) (adenine(37)-N6)-methyltransferase [Desulfovibrio porci]|uniref:tRNA1(Val) (adenine(37)-N6)-methyltransferase n=1 Tax=Desulfovibrio porci TaxID=2605782 RepID=UPI0012B35419|nr:methyltransferase domain-containing protein [Desulfovibrio porci]